MLLYFSFLLQSFSFLQLPESQAPTWHIPFVWCHSDQTTQHPTFFPCGFESQNGLKFRITEWFEVTLRIISFQPLLGQGHIWATSITNTPLSNGNLWAKFSPIKLPIKGKKRIRIFWQADPTVAMPNRSVCCPLSSYPPTREWSKLNKRKPRHELLKPTQIKL